MRSALPFLIFMLLSISRLSAAQEIPIDQVKPGATITFDLPELGTSARSANAGGTACVQAQIYLPVNYDSKASLPVLVYLGGGVGDINMDSFYRIFAKRNFILLAVDYSAPLKDGFRNAAHVLQLMTTAVPYDHKSVVMMGQSSGAYAIARDYAGEFGKLFCAFFLMIGGTDMDAGSVANRPVLLMGGENDTTASRIELMLSCFHTLHDGGAQVEFVYMRGVGHDCPENLCFPPFKKWLYAIIPNREMRSAAVINAQLASTKSAWRTAFLRKRAAESLYSFAE